MKKTTISTKRYQPFSHSLSCRYPNAANRRDYLDRLADTMLTVATVCGIITILVVLFAAF